jgi:hypothetical protein
MLKVSFIVKVIVLVFLSIQSRAQEVDKEYVGISKNPDVQTARNEILENAQKETIGALIAQFIGKEKMTQHQKVIQEKVYAESSKYLTSYRTSNVSNQNGEMKMTVTMKINLPAIKSTLVKYKLLGAATAGSQHAVHLIIRKTSGLVMFDQLRSELQTQVPEFSFIRERAISKSSIEYIVEMATHARLAPGRFLQVQGKRCELQMVSHDKIECDLN